jgi:hypothetical protein
LIDFGNGNGDDFSNWLADEPGVTPMWWRQYRGRFPKRVHAEFDQFVLALERYCESMDHAHMDTVVSTVKALQWALRSSETRVISGRVFGKTIGVGVRVGNERPNIVRALDNLLVVLRPWTDLTPENYRV